MSKRRKKHEDEEESRPAEVAILGELFEEGEADIVNALLDAPPESEVTLYIDCAGGSVYAAMAIVTLMRLRKLKTTAVVIGECSSSAILIFAACPKRIVTPRSSFLFHHVRWRSEKDVRSIEASRWAEHFLWLEKELDEYQASMFGIAPEKFEPWIREGRFVTGAEMVELGLAEMVEV